MGLNIKNERVHRLAREAARLTGRSQTGAIEEALERLLRDYGSDPAATRVAEKVARVRAHVARYHETPGDDARAVRSVEDLYDEQGLPR